MLPISVWTTTHTLQAYIVHTVCGTHAHTLQAYTVHTVCGTHAHTLQAYIVHTVCGTRAHTNTIPSHSQQPWQHAQEPKKAISLSGRKKRRGWNGRRGGHARTIFETVFRTDFRTDFSTIFSVCWPAQAIINEMWFKISLIEINYRSQVRDVSVT